MTEEKTAKPKMTGTALELDVIKKIAHQLSREGLSYDAKDRIVQFVFRTVRDDKASTVANMNRNGQLGLLGGQSGANQAAMDQLAKQNGTGFFGDDL